MDFIFKPLTPEAARLMRGKQPKGRAVSLRYAKQWIWLIIIKWVNRRGIEVKTTRYRVAAPDKKTAEIRAQRLAAVEDPEPPDWKRHFRVVSVTQTGAVAAG